MVIANIQAVSHLTPLDQPMSPLISVTETPPPLLLLWVEDPRPTAMVPITYLPVDSLPPLLLPRTVEVSTLPLELRKMVVGVHPELLLPELWVAAVLPLASELGKTERTS